jgi:hypothetical protein
MIAKKLFSQGEYAKMFKPFQVYSSKQMMQHFFAFGNA